MKSRMVLLALLVVASYSARLLRAEDLAIPLPGPLGIMLHPKDNEPNPRTIALGKELFFDRQLSRNEQIACATCHNPAKGFSNGERFAVGIDGKPGTRNVPGLLNVGYSNSLYWDGRATTLEEQSLLPIQHPKEMDLPLDALVKKLNVVPKYRAQFLDAFGGEATPKRIAQALAAYERTLISNETPFDRFLSGDKMSLPPKAARGMRLFFGEARCAICHQGPNFTDEKFHNIGAAEPNEQGRRAVTRKMNDHGAFRTPQLREVGRTAPYMHNGRFKTLSKVVQHYNFGGVTDQQNDNRDQALQVLYLSEDDVADLVAFLSEGLTSPANR